MVIGREEGMEDQVLYFTLMRISRPDLPVARLHWTPRQGIIPLSGRSESQGCLSPTQVIVSQLLSIDREVYKKQPYYVHLPL